MEEKLPGGDYTAIIASTKAVEFESGSVALLLQLIVARGPHRGRRCEKKLFFPFDQVQLAKSQFVRLGGALRSLATVGEDALELVGSLLSIQLSYDDVGRQKVLVFRQLGRDDVKRYL